MSPEDQQFSDEKFMCAAEKKAVLRAWIRFLESGCKKNQFTEALYHHLIQHCSFIAHYDRHGYYGVYFERLTPDIFRFFDQFDPQKPGVSAEYGATYWLSVGATGTDLNAAMREAAGPYLDGLRRHFEEVQRQAGDRGRYSPPGKAWAHRNARKHIHCRGVLPCGAAAAKGCNG
jgi:hypothetical protein